MAPGGPATTLPGSVPARLKRDALPFSQIIGATLANIGPALGVLFNFGLLAAMAGVGMPIIVVFGAVAILFLCNTLAQFSHFQPSSGSFVTFIGLAFGPAAGAGASLFLMAGYCVAAAGIVAIAGGWMAEILSVYAGIAVPWQAVSIAVCLATGVLVWRGVGLSTHWATLFLAFETVLLAVVSAALLWLHRAWISPAPLAWSALKNGLGGLGVAFPFGIYLFVGWENSAMMAEEALSPRKNVPRALFGGSVAVGVIYLIVAYAVEVAFHANAAAIGASENPFMDAVRASLPAMVILVYAAGVTSLISCMIGMTNGQSRILFSAGREGLLPAVFGAVHARHRTPHVAATFYLAFACVIALGMGTRVRPLDIFNEAGTLGTIVLILTYMAANVALPVYVLMRQREAFRVIPHLAVPLSGTILMLVPAWGLLQPGQPAPYAYFPAMALGMFLAAAAYGFVIARVRPGLARRVGSVVADI